MAQFLCFAERSIINSKETKKWSDVHLIVITSSQIDHYVLVPASARSQQRKKESIISLPIEEHDGARVI